MTDSDKNLISIVVPVFGGEEYVEQCIDSIVLQTHHNLEIILVDDGSPDGAGVICDKAAQLDKRIHVIHQPNLGLVRARKAGVSIATGKYLGFVDGDDWVGADYFGNMHELVASSSADLVISGHVRDFLGKQEAISPLINPGIYSQLEIRDAILPKAIFNGSFFQHGISTYVWNKLFKRQEASRVIREIPKDIVVGEDAALTYPYLYSTSSLVIWQEGEYFYRQRPRSILKSVQDVNVEYRRLSVLFQYLTEFFGKDQSNSDVHDQLRKYFYALAIIRSGGVIQSPTNGGWFTPFTNLTLQQKVVVFSSGSFGQLLFEALNNLGLFDIVGWIDEDSYESQSVGLPVTSMDSLKHMDFDLIVIASLDPDYSAVVAAQLELLGINSDKISRALPDFAKLEVSLRSVGFNLDDFNFRPMEIGREF